ncbi:MAG: AbrB/MazE/SpoVT family DNA-binding domain-containing protein [Rhodopseudomonas palustris]|uniref:AbrB/MazE/SpoVT family DNA-binding domain-containing protein n=1 Tax=Rhodopseudomonas palustris TaxID=1076 RepID=A0A933VVC3_RHOPL|nr:AbrB/MazE/SpoVT family DNA-binding domain-containing protein [Rhodopseudomonas palustris]
MASRVTSDGQVTIPPDVLEALGVAPGEEIDFKRAADGAVVLEKAARSDPNRPWDKARGSADAGMSGEELIQLLRDGD